MDPKLHAALVLMKKSFENSKAYSLLLEEEEKNPEKRRERYDAIQKALDEVARKEARSLENMENRYIRGR